MNTPNVIDGPYAGTYAKVGVSHVCTIGTTVYRRIFVSLGNYVWVEQSQWVKDRAAAAKYRPLFPEEDNELEAAAHRRCLRQRNKPSTNNDE